MSERLVTSADEAAKCVDCGHSWTWHESRAGRHCEAHGCRCANHPADVRLDALDALVRREVAKELRAFAAKLRQDVDATGPPRTHADITCATAILSDAAEAEKRATAIESGGQS